MTVTTRTFHDEFWGAKVPVEEIEVNESYDNEVFEIVSDMIDNGKIECIPDELDVTCEYSGKEATMCPFEYLSNTQITELEKMIEKATKE